MRNQGSAFHRGYLPVRPALLRKRVGPDVEIWLYRGYTDDIKTAISLPDALYADAEKTAKSMGIPRSQLFAKALEEYIKHHKRERITERLNEVYAGLETSGDFSIAATSPDSLRELTKNDTW